MGFYILILEERGKKARFYLESEQPKRFSKDEELTAAVADCVRVYGSENVMVVQKVRTAVDVSVTFPGLE